jgi:hypothetical protein
VNLFIAKHKTMMSGTSLILTPWYPESIHRQPVNDAASKIALKIKTKNVEMSIIETCRISL